MYRELNDDLTAAITKLLVEAGRDWNDVYGFAEKLRSYIHTPKDPPAKSDVDAAWVKATAEAILKSGCKMSPNAQTFVGQTFARASQYPTVRFSPKQWEWYNKLMLDAGVESMEMVTLGTPRVDFVNNRGE